jgi:hypothetical protein
MALFQIWRDIAIMTNDPSRCPAYVAESQNVKSRHFCQVPESLMTSQIKKQKEGWIPITQAGCEALSFFDATKNATVHGKWQEKAAWGIDAPICRENQWSRDNHHGNVAASLTPQTRTDGSRRCRASFSRHFRSHCFVIVCFVQGSGGFMASFNWTVPDTLIHERCVLRLRYNISTGDTIEWNNNTVQAGFLGDFNSNPLNKNGQENRDPAYMKQIWERFGLNYSDVSDSFKGINADNAAALKNTRGYVLKNNPRVSLHATSTILTSGLDGTISAHHFPDVLLVASGGHVRPSSRRWSCEGIHQDAVGDQYRTVRPHVRGSHASVRHPSASGVDRQGRHDPQLASAG